MEHRVDVAIPPLDQIFTYKLSQSLAEEIEIGHRVFVPFGRRNATGYVVSKSAPGQSSVSDDGIVLKSVEQSALNQRCFSPSQLEFFQWLADYYREPLARVIETAIPTPVPRRIVKVVSLVSKPELDSRSLRQGDIVKFLEANGGSAGWELLQKKFRGSTQVIKRLVEKGAVRIDSSDAPPPIFFPDKVPSWARSAVELNEAQSSALEAIQGAVVEHKFQPFLLHGVTGSGKTEVYIEALLLAVRQNLGALVIVPEIALTPQLIDRFRARLGHEISVLHSAVSPRLRWEAWLALMEGRHKIAIGTRSAVFAPVQQLGLIIVDEEHDQSFKQSDGLRYHARDLSVVRGRLESCPVILGSATPSLETFHNAACGKYSYLKLPSRPGSTPPLEIELVDLNQLRPFEMVSKNISPQLHQALKTVLDAGQQAFVLYNRRGFASYLQCEACETVVGCPNCSVTMTYHQSNNALLCHYCNLSTVPPQFCQKCAADGPPKRRRKQRPGKDQGNTAETSETPRLVQRGAGTERIFDELRELFPEVPIARLDRDAVTQHDQYRAILDSVRSGATQLLVGTQMIAKGHDLPGVTLVGIADCDVGLHMPDFRATERVFQLLTQAAGRAGRSNLPGKVLLQTRVPSHPSLVNTITQDYRNFAELELKGRKILKYPPFVKLVRIVAASQKSEEPAAFLAALRRQAQELISRRELRVTVLGPAPAPIEKLRAHWRWHLLFKSSSAAHLNSLVKMLKMAKSSSRTLRVAYDIDPQDMM